MRSSLPTALALIRQHEGGYVDHPRDPGGCTNLGITIHAFRRHIRPGGTCADLRRLTWPQAAEIYTQHYWHAARGDELPAGIDVSVADMAVNAGPRNAIRLLQKALRVTSDGQLGPITLGAARAREPLALVDAYAAMRLAYYKDRKTWRTFGRGWAARNEATRRAARALITHARQEAS